MRLAAGGAPKMRGIAQKDLTLHAWLPTILPCIAGTRSPGTAGALKGQRGSFGRQPSLAPLHEAYAHGVTYYSISIMVCASFFVSAPMLIVASPVHGDSPER